MAEIKVTDIFTNEKLTGAVKRMRSPADGSSLVENPFRRAILYEFGAELAAAIAHEVCAGTWKPESAYVCTTTKGPCGYRELCFPGLVDAIVARAIVDSIEAQITADDNGRTFCGRSYANAAREPGDYEKWFEVWQDYSAAITKACEPDGYAYVYTTDVADFFPSVSRSEAKKELARRTSASPELLELLFYALEAWLPRVAYAPMSGLPIDDIDVSRLIAHNFLKQVDQAVISKTGSYEYLRFVDDAVFIVKTKDEAEEASRKHHRALRAVGLNPSAAKSGILSTADYQSARQRDANLRLEVIGREKDEKRLAEFAAEWHDLDPKQTAGWQRVCLRIYAVATKLASRSLDSYAVKDVRLANDSRLIQAVFRYLLSHPFALSEDNLLELIGHCARPTFGAERAIYVSTFLADGAFAPAFSKLVANAAYGNITEQSFDTPGRGFAKANLVLAGYKHGGREFRDRLRNWVNTDAVRRISDPHLRATYLYTMACRKELSENERRALMVDTTRDTHFTLRLADTASSGKLTQIGPLLKIMRRPTPGGVTISARYLPLLWAIADAHQDRTLLTNTLDSWEQSQRKVIDEVVLDHVRKCRSHANG